MNRRPAVRGETPRVLMTNSTVASESAVGDEWITGNYDEVFECKQRSADPFGFPCKERATGKTKRDNKRNQELRYRRSFTRPGGNGEEDPPSRPTHTNAARGRARSHASFHACFLSIVWEDARARRLRTQQVETARPILNPRAWIQNASNMLPAGTIVSLYPLKDLLRHCASVLFRLHPRNGVFWLVRQCRTLFRHNTPIRGCVGIPRRL